MKSGLVSAVIPAFNASKTLDETILSVRGQTHRELDIIVVDDGSDDDTGGVAASHARLDPRVRVLTQANRGVAAARNAGWQAARSDLIAFVDADDLWRASKIEKQFSVIRSSGPEVGLVYTWYEFIDEASRVTERWTGPAFEGNVLDQLILANFIGNGSSALIRREALEQVGGFEPRLRSAGAQGCEDILLYCRIAGQFEFRVVPEYLVGYRLTPGNMSANSAKMMRSFLLVAEELHQTYPHKQAIVQEGLRRYSRWLIRRTVFKRSLRELSAVLMTLGADHPGLALRSAVFELPTAINDALTSRLSRRYTRPRAKLP